MHFFFLWRQIVNRCCSVTSVTRRHFVFGGAVITFWHSLSCMALCCSIDIRRPPPHSNSMLMPVLSISEGQHANVCQMASVSRKLKGWGWGLLECSSATQTSWPAWRWRPQASLTGLRSGEDKCNKLSTFETLPTNHWGWHVPLGLWRGNKTVRIIVELVKEF